MRIPCIKRCAAVVLALSFAGAGSVAQAGAPITLDSAYLGSAKAQLAAGDAPTQAALRQLLQEADTLLARRPESVTYKRIVPPSGDKHDYLSMAPYWWPDPARPNGLPYRQRDGEFNPAARNDDTDSIRMQAMCEGVHRLSLAYYFTGDAKYAQKSADAVRTWFLDPQTRMNPHLKFGQAIMGKVEGRGIGLIDTRNLWMVIDAVALIEDSGRLTAADTLALKQWFREFAGWMEQSTLGQDEAAAKNNHGMFFDMQLAVYSMFTGDAAKARRTVEHALRQRIAVQVEPDGRQPLELARTTPFHYSVFNLEAMVTLARYGEQVGVDVWHGDSDGGRGLRQAIDFLLPFARKPDTWTYRELRAPDTGSLMPVLLQAERAYGSGQYAAVAQLLEQASARKEVLAAQDRLAWAPRPKE